MLGIGDFYYELGVKLILQGLVSRSKNGGLLPLDTACSKLKCSKDDIQRALKKVEVLGNGLQLVDQEGVSLLVSTPHGLSPDHADLIALLSVCEGRKFTLGVVQAHFHTWSNERALRNVRFLMGEGLLWVDKGGEQDEYYALPQ